MAMLPILFMTLSQFVKIIRNVQQKIAPDSFTHEIFSFTHNLLSGPWPCVRLVPLFCRPTELADSRLCICTSDYLLSGASHKHLVFHVTVKREPIIFYVFWAQVDTRFRGSSMSEAWSKTGPDRTPLSWPPSPSDPPMQDVLQSFFF